MRAGDGAAAPKSFLVAELEAAADRRIRMLGADPGDRISAAAAELLQRLADEVHGLQGSPAYREFMGLCGWLDESDTAEDFALRAEDYRAAIGESEHPADGEAYLRRLISLAREASGS